MNYPFWLEVSFCLEEIEKEKLRLKNQTNSEKLTEVRDQINHRLEQLRLSFEQSLDKSFASLALFPVVAYVDEDIQRYLVTFKHINWSPLQKDFYGAYNAGEMFYETIDKIINDPYTPQIVLQMFYFFLKKGFLGKYRDSKIHIARYLDILREKIPVDLPPSKISPDLDVKNKKPKIKKWHYYTAAFLGSSCLLIILYVTSSLG